jgi:hypothetical protein
LINDGGVTDQVRQWEIDKVIDWDRVLAVPEVLARKPPVWLWTSSESLDNFVSVEFLRWRYRYPFSLLV